MEATHTPKRQHILLISATISILLGYKYPTLFLLGSILTWVFIVKTSTNKNKFIKNLYGFGGFAIVFLLGVFTGPKSYDTGAVDACVKKGISYFIEIGSYPTLTQPPNTGRLAEDVARERCNNSVDAF